MPESPFSKPAAGSEISKTDELAVLPVDPQEHMDDMMAKAQAALGPVPSNKEDPPAEEEQKEEDPFVEEIMTEVSDEAKRAFIRSLLSGERFKHSVELFGGEVLVTFQTRQVDENKICRKVANNQFEEPTAAYRELLQMVYSVDTITYGETTITSKELIVADAIHLEIFGQMCDVLYYAVLNEFRHFEDICDVLFKKANDPDFWSRTDGAS